MAEINKINVYKKYNLPGEALSMTGITIDLELELEMNVFKLAFALIIGLELR